MIIDGVEVLYTMRNGKIVDPNIPMNGLVCCLDTRGKYNTDIYRNTLLDLSGNGNHGKLRNFNFTEESGYVKDLSGGGTSGLKFDGVDDNVIYIPFDTTVTDDYTAYIDFTLTDNLPDIDLVPIFWAFGDVFILTLNASDPTHSLRYYVRNLDGRIGYVNTFKKLQLGNRYKIIVVREGLIFKIYVDGVKIVEETFTSKTGQLLGKLYTFSDTAVKSLNPSKLHKVALYNRALTDEEATKLMEE